MSEMIAMLVNFEKVGIKKTPERHAVLKAIKDRIESENIDSGELIEVVEAYPTKLKSKVSQ